mmetsp:Transcript_118875/g.341422  ORF Transcript_118875/g.341422 Transcript_118875/m.341422 type:complete len:581 (+) Transcript_118875:181-1923(+)
MEQHGPVGSIAQALRQSHRSAACAEDDASSKRETASTRLLQDMLADYAARGQSYEDEMPQSQQRALPSCDHKVAAGGCAGAAFVPVPPPLPRKHEACHRLARSQFTTATKDLEEFSAEDVERPSSVELERDSRLSADSSALEALAAISPPAGRPLDAARDSRRSRFAYPQKSTDAVEAISRLVGECAGAPMVPTDPRLSKKLFSTVEIRRPPPMASEPRTTASREQFKSVQVSKEQFFAGKEVEAPTKLAERVLKEKFRTAETQRPVSPKDQRTLFSRANLKIAASVPKEGGDAAEDQHIEQRPKELFKTAAPCSRDQHTTADNPLPMGLAEKRTLVPKELLKTAAPFSKDQYASAENQSPMAGKQRQALISKEQFKTANGMSKEQFYSLENRGPCTNRDKRSFTLSNNAFGIDEPVSRDHFRTAENRSRVSRESFSTCDAGACEQVEFALAQLASAEVAPGPQFLFEPREEEEEARVSFTAPPSPTWKETSGVGTAGQAAAAEEPERISFGHLPLVQGQQATPTVVAGPPLAGPAQGIGRRGRLMPFAALPAAANGARAALMSANLVFEVTRSVFEAED